MVEQTFNPSTLIPLSEERERKEDPCEFKHYRASSRQPELHREALSQNKQTTTKQLPCQKQRERLTSYEHRCLKKSEVLDPWS